MKIHPSYLLVIFLSLFGSTTLRAQTSAPYPEKEIVVVDLFARNRNVPPAYLEALRQQVLGAFADRGRNRIVDAAASPDLAPPPMDWGFVEPANAAAQQNAFMQNRMQTLLGIGARYVVTGAVTDYKFEHVDLPAGSNNRPRPGFRATFQVVLSGYDLKLDTPIPDRTYVLKADAPVAEDADKMAISTLRSQLAFYVDNSFRFETIILQLGPSDPRKGVRELYIHSGTSMGVTPGDLFEVYEEIPIGGVISRQKIGRLRVNNVQDMAVAKCKIAKGNAEITDAFLAGRTLICISAGKALFF